MKFSLPPRLKPYLVPVLLGGVFLFFLLILTGEWYLMRESLVDRRAPVAKPDPKSLGEAVVLEATALPAVDQFSEMIERPLFMETRRPNPPTAIKPVKLEPPAPVTFRLMGVIDSPRGKTALISDAKGKYKRLRPKEHQDGWEISEITPDHLHLEQQGEAQDLSLLKKRPKGETTTQPNEAVPAPPPTPAAEAPKHAPPTGQQPIPAPHYQGEMESETYADPIPQDE